MNRQFRCDCLTLVAVMVISFLLMFSVAAMADGTEYTGGTKTVICTDATTREDGSALLPEDIDRVEIYVGNEPGTGQPEVTILMSGGCAPASLDLSRLTEGQKYQYGVTFDTAGRVSVASDSLPFVYKMSPPGSPAMVE